MGQDVGVAFAAAAGKLLGGQLSCRNLIRADGHARDGREEGGPLGDAVETAHGRALTNAARVEPDNVKVRGQRLRQRGVQERQALRLRSRQDHRGW